MARGRKPEVSVTSRLKPNVESTSNTVRSKSTPNHFIEKNNTNRSTRSSIQGISTTSKKSVQQVEVPITSRSKSIPNIEPNTHSRFFSIKNLEATSTTRSRPTIESISSTVNRSKPVTKELERSNNSSASGIPSIHNSKTTIGIGSIPRSTRNGPLRISEL